MLSVLKHFFFSKETVFTYLQLISSVLSPSEDEAENIEQKHGAHGCYDNKVLGFAESAKLTKYLLEFDFVWLHEEISAKSG